MRTFLFVPASRLERVPKAVASGASDVVIDLEDAVLDTPKSTIYQALDEFCKTWDWQKFSRIWLRVSGVRHGDFESDVRCLSEFFGVVLPKVQSADDIWRLKALTDKPIIAMIECAKGVLDVANIAKTPIWAMSYGGLDLAKSLGMTTGTPSANLMFDRVRTELVLWSVACGLNPPIETVYADFVDDDGLLLFVQKWRDLGFGGQFLIHPRQVATAKKALIDPNRLAFAQKVVAHASATGQAVFAIDGQMVDLPVIDWARDYLANCQSL